jgi:SAM-dependent methyltransferase
MTTPPLTADDLQRISARTLAHYNQHAQAFWEGTRDHDVSQNIEALLGAIRSAAPFELLDLGCGPGRDLATFQARGHHATGLEGSAELAAMARDHSGCEVLEQSFLALALPAGLAVPCAGPGAAARAARAARGAQARRGAVLLEPARCG